MKFLKLFSVVIGCLLLLHACKKTDVFTDRPSYGSLKDSSGECLPSSVNGTFQAGVTLLVDNYIDVHVNVDSVGSYTIATDSVNGYYFKGTGTFGVKGDNLVRLYGHGKPSYGGVNIFTVSYGTTSCGIAVTVGGTAAVPAVYTLDTLAGACPGAVLDGVFSTRIPATAANKATLHVVVTTPGVYNIATTPVNGISFSGSGAFTAAGPQNIVLTASGTPLVAGAFNYTATVNGVSCTYSVNVVEGPAAAAFTLGGSPASCSGFVLVGTYKAGTALSSGNTVSCQVNVTTAGAYSITTNTVNGISFSASGVFATTGTQTVTLAGTGTPAAAATNTFTATAGASTCTFSVTTAAGGGGPVINTNFYFKATINSKAVSYTVNTPANIIGGVTESKNGPPLSPAFYEEGFDISDFNQNFKNEIDVSIGKLLGADPTVADKVAMFHLGSYDYGVNSDPSVTTGAYAFITYYDENGDTWISKGAQTGSTFSITELIDDTVSGNAMKIFTAKFSCKLYNVTTNASINLVNGEIRGGVVSP